MTAILEEFLMIRPIEGRKSRELASKGPRNGALVAHSVSEATLEGVRSGLPGQTLQYGRQSRPGKNKVQRLLMADRPQRSFRGPRMGMNTWR